MPFYAKVCMITNALVLTSCMKVILTKKKKKEEKSFILSFLKTVTTCTLCRFMILPSSHEVCSSAHALLERQPRAASNRERRLFRSAQCGDNSRAATNRARRLIERIRYPQRTKSIITSFRMPWHLLCRQAAQVVSGIEPIQTRPHFVIRTSCRGEATRTPPT